MQRASAVTGGGEQVSARGFNTSQWQAAVVPGTVLTSLVNNGVYPDPYFGDINRRSRHIIPDIADSGRAFYHYWYRTNFAMPSAFTGKRIWLKLHGINYRSDVWLNGKKLGSMAGMFITKTFDITEIVQRTGNVLAIDVQPVDVPGGSGLKTFKPNGAVGENSNGGNGEIGQNITMLMSVGWDFTVPDGVRDRNTGIWREVEIFATGNVLLEHPFTYSKFPAGDTNAVQQTVSVEVLNTTAVAQTGVVQGLIKEAGIVLKKKVDLLPNERKTIVFSPGEYRQLLITKPKLWWPVNKGPQNLYTLQLSFQQNNQPSHTTTVRFGIREITSDQQTPDSSRRFLVNGYPVFIRGTNWIPEAMLRSDAKRTNAELRYTRQAGLNLLRLWGGGIAESDYFYQRCDELGLLVWTEYWITGDTKFPTDTALYLKNVASTVKRLRNHASLAYHVSSNESTEMPGAAELIKTLDPSRGYQMQSECCGVHDGSPYKYENPMQYFENTASRRGSRVNGFNPEYGTPCLPTVESLREMMPAKDLWPINDSVWNYLDGGGFHQVTKKYRDAVNQFGTSVSIEAFAKKAQFVGAMNYRSIWEVWNYNKFQYGDRFASGFLFWYHNSPVRQTGGRMYDWSLEPTAALYYSQNALEPLHAQFDYLKNTVSVYNDYRRAFNGYRLIAELYDIQSRKMASKEVLINIPADGLVKDALLLEFPAGISAVHFIKLSLKDNLGKSISSSFYWRSTDKYQGAWTLTGPAVSGFQQLNKLPYVSLTTTAILKKKKLEVTVNNPVAALAFFVQLKVQNEKGKSITPVFYTNNFFSLLPGEKRSVIVDLEEAGLAAGETFRLVTDGFNVKPQTQVFIIQ